MLGKTFIKVGITFTFSLLLIILATSKTYAQDSVCTPSEGLYTRIVQALDNLDIRRTTVNFLVSAVTDVPLQAAANGTQDDIFHCMGYIATMNAGGNQGGSTGADVLAKLGLSTDGCTPDEDYCEALFNTYEDVRIQSGANPASVAFYNKRANSRVSGSLVGLVNMAENATYQPVPVNLAFYFNKEAQKLPFVGTAFAQTAGDFTGPFLNLTYDLWKIFRDVAYGVMAVIMIIVGIMIMTRKKLNPQTAVTMQYALPRIIIALVLITFSYVIGATIASTAWVLKFSADKIIIQLFIDSQAQSTQHVSFMYAAGFMVTLVIGVIMMFTSGVGVVYAALFIVGFILTLITFLIVFLKMLMLYLRMLINIIAAPLTFTMAALPGKDDMMMNWFKQMLVYTLSIFGMTAVISITRIVSAVMLLNIADNGGNTIFDGGRGAGAFLVFGPILLFIILIYGLNTARKLPNKIEAAIMGPKKR